ncbi:hypothetical protein T484DRAFT_1776068 [Baffinella frigidus]|nr:hypothetical protein T484DRAFT_1776068 [Cryptophyta sp. CCMP2293]
MFVMRVYLPVAESLGFNEEMSRISEDHVFAQSVFDHWEVVDGDPLVDGPLRRDVIAPLRTGKGLPAAIPPLDRYLDSHRMGRGTCTIAASESPIPAGGARRTPSGGTGRPLGLIKEELGAGGGRDGHAGAGAASGGEHRE